MESRQQEAAAVCLLLAVPEKSEKLIRKSLSRIEIPICCSLPNHADQNGFSTKPAIMQKGKLLWLTFFNSQAFKGVRCSIYD